MTYIPQTSARVPAAGGHKCCLVAPVISLCVALFLGFSVEAAAAGALAAWVLGFLL